MTLYRLLRPKYYNSKRLVPNPINLKDPRSP